jgi:hypothetical protein
MSDRVQVTFESPVDAATNPKVEIKYGQIRDNVHMYGAFCVSKIQAGEFICAWNGFQVMDDENVDSFTNVYDLTKYAISFPGKGGQKIFSCVRLDKDGSPKLPGSFVNDPRDISLAVFLNEPADDEYALYDVRKDSISLHKKSRNLSNVCLKTQPQRKLGIVCPLMFASRDINIGEELVWDYGTMYDRRIYQIDEDKDIFSSGIEYKKNIAKDNDCKVTCWTVEFKQKLPIEVFSPNLFLIDSNMNQQDIQRIKFRSRRYMSEFSDTETNASDEYEQRPSKKRRRKFKLKIHNVEYKDVHEQERLEFKKMEKTLNIKADLICAQIRNLKVTGKTNPKKKEFIDFIKNILIHSIWLEYTYVHPNTSMFVTQFFIRPDFRLTEATVQIFIQAGDSHWKDIMAMQYRFLQSIEFMCDKRMYDPESIRPNLFAGMFKSLTGVYESVSDWQEESFIQDFPNASKIALAFFDKLKYISNIADHYFKWKSICDNIKLHQMKFCAGINSMNNTIYLKVDELISTANFVLKQNSFEAIVDEWIYELIFKLLIHTEKYLIESCVAKTHEFNKFLSKLSNIFNEFQTQQTAEYLEDHEIFQKIKNICNYNISWRAESLLTCLRIR